MREQPVVLADALGAGKRAGLDLAQAGGHGQVGDEGVFGFAAAMGDDGGPAVRWASSMESRVSVTDADLVDLDENAVAAAFRRCPS